VLFSEQLSAGLHSDSMGKLQGLHDITDQSRHTSHIT